MFLRPPSIFFSAFTRTRDIRLLGGDRLPHGTITAVYRTGVITSTWYPRDRRRCRCRFPGSDFACPLNYSRRSIGCALPCQSAAVPRRVRSTVNTTRGKVDLAGHVSRERNIAIRSNGRRSVNRD